LGVVLLGVDGEGVVGEGCAGLVVEGVYVGHMGLFVEEFCVFWREVEGVVGEGAVVDEVVYVEVDGCLDCRLGFCGFLLFLGEVLQGFVFGDEGEEVGKDGFGLVGFSEVADDFGQVRGGFYVLGYCWVGAVVGFEVVDGV